MEGNYGASDASSQTSATEEKTEAETATAKMAIADAFAGVSLYCFFQLRSTVRLVYCLFGI